MIWAVVPAAGRGLRAGGASPKQYADLAGRPMLHWTLDALMAHPRIAGVMLVLAGDDRYWPAGYESPSSKPVLTCTGGADRASSVRAGLAALADQLVASDWVLVHDAARPCLELAELDALLAAAGAHPVGALLALAVADTLKRGNERDESIATVPRQHVWRAQTPQVFRHGELLAALDAAARDGVVLTDEASALERLGRYPVLVPGRASNLKVTVAEDFALAAWWLSRR